MNIKTRTFLTDGENLKIFSYATCTEVVLHNSVKGLYSSVKIRGEIFEYDRLLIVEKPYELMYLNDVEMYDVWLENNSMDAVTRDRVMGIVCAAADYRFLYKHDMLECEYEDVAYRVREILLSRGVELKNLNYNALELRLIGMFI